MSATMHVAAAPGLKVPKEGNPHAYITQDEAQAVPESYYYLRRVSDGDLVIVAAATVKTAPAPAKTKASNTKE